MTSSTYQVLHESPAFLAELDHALVCREISAGWRERLKLVADEPVAIPAAELLGLEANAELLNRIADVLRNASVIRDEPVRLSSPEGPIDGSLSAWPVQASVDDRPSVFVAVATAAELTQALNALSELQRQHQLILDAAGEGIYGLDADGLTTFGNAATEQILGWNPDEIKGQPAHDVHHHSRTDGSPYPRTECPIFAALKDGEVHRVDNEVFWHTDGSPVPVEYTCTPILKDGKPGGAVVVFRDISARRAVELQREQAYVEIKQLTEQLEQERDYLRDEINVTVNFGEIIGESPALKRTFAQIEAVAPTPVNVLILGESGVGKEMIARAIHNKSNRVDKALVKVNCASIPKDLFESEFFGHVKGAFTGAHQDRVGRLQLAAGGTLFLDEVGEIPLALQGKLLRVLQEQEFERVGDDQTVKVDLRVVAATNRDLQEEVKAGRFREDLFYRLSVFPIEVPPLRERPEDIIPLTAHFLECICRELGRAAFSLTRQQAAILRHQDWPGNIRELKNVVDRAVILSRGDRLRLDLALPGSGAGQVAADKPADDDTDYLTENEFREKEKQNMLAALQHAQGRVWGPDGAAALLGIKPSTFSYRMDAMGINKKDVS